MAQAFAHDDYPEKPVSPYGTPVQSVLEVPTTGPLMPFEERQVKNLIQQLDAAPPRVKSEFFARLAALHGPVFYGGTV